VTYSTVWDGFGCNTFVDQTQPGVLLLEPHACIVTLPETPGTPLVVSLPAQTRALRVWTSAEDGLRFATDATPAPVGVVTSGNVPASAFALGDTVFANLWQVFAIPADGALHTVSLTSGGGFVRVLLVALVEP
jgi:hypothetical protein